MSLPILKLIAIDATDTRYYNVKDLVAAFPDKFIELRCKSRPRKIIERAKIPDTSYVYATYTAMTVVWEFNQNTYSAKTHAWILSAADCKKAQLLVASTWVDAHFYGQETPGSSEIA